MKTEATAGGCFGGFKTPFQLLVVKINAVKAADVMIFIRLFF